MEKSIHELKKNIAIRDNLTMDEVNHLFAVVQEEINDALFAGDVGLVEELLEGELGLEPDYIFFFI